MRTKTDMPLDHTFRLPPSRCECGELLDAATGLDHDCSPKPGSLCVCIVCARVNRFDSKLALRAVTPEQFAELPEDVRAELRKLVRLVSGVHRPRRR